MVRDPQVGQVWNPTRPRCRTTACIIVGRGPKGQVENARRGSQWSVTVTWSLSQWNKWVQANAAVCELAMPDEVALHQAIRINGSGVFDDV